MESGSLFESLPFSVIANVGSARSMYIEAIHLARNGAIKEARERMKEGELLFVEGHGSHLKMFGEELSVEDLRYIPLLMHAEDQLMSAETLKIVCEEMIDILEEHKA